ncbi:class I SAM-dependent methyltransferase [Balneolaceae bacterium ANBcel3]|nr:class I SAM-dependent methyltransferase [Balneolaceae bacterium ANBcel3]
MKNIDVPRETHRQVDALYSSSEVVFNDVADRWLWWNKSINIFSPGFKKSDVLQHIHHSLYVFPFLPGSNIDCFDVGTGGGLPGVPLAIADPGRRYHLVDKVQKKMIVLKNILSAFSICNAQSIHSNVHKLTFERAPCVVSKYAFKIDNLLEMLSGQRIHSYILLKGEDVFDELAAIPLQDYHVSSFHIGSSGIDFYRGKYVITIIPKQNHNL